MWWDPLYIALHPSVSDQPGMDQRWGAQGDPPPPRAPRMGSGEPCSTARPQAGTQHPRGENINLFRECGEINKDIKVEFLVGF